MVDYVSIFRCDHLIGKGQTLIINMNLKLKASPSGQPRSPTHAVYMGPFSSLGEFDLELGSSDIYVFKTRIRGRHFSEKPLGRSARPSSGVTSFESIGENVGAESLALNTE